MALTTVTFDPAQITDGNASGASGDNQLEAGGLIFTITAQGNWTANFNNNRFNFAEDPAFGSGQFVIRISKATAATFTYSDFQISYEVTPKAVGQWPMSMQIGPISSLSDNLFSGGPRTLQSFGFGTIGPIPYLEMKDYTVEGVNGTSTLWLDNIVADVNLLPVISNFGSSDNFTYRVGDGVASVDRGAAVTIADADSSGWNGGTLTLRIQSGGVSADDKLAIRSNGPVSVSGSTVSYSGTAIGSFTGGTAGANLVVTFNAQATDAAIAAVAHELTYENINAAALSGSRTLALTVKDGAGASSATQTSIVTVVAPNHAPTVTATGGTPVFTENGPAVDLFSAVGVSTGDVGQFIKEVKLQVTGLADGAAEVLTIDGKAVALTNGNVQTTADGHTVAVAISGSVATIAVALVANTLASETKTLIDGLVYSNTSEAPTAGTRHVTLTSIQDDGGTADGGQDTKALNIDAAVVVTAVNDAPGVLAPVSLSVAEGGQLTLAGISMTDVDAGTGLVKLTLAASEGSLAPTSGGGVTVAGAGSGSLSLQGTTADINAFLAGSNVVFVPVANGVPNVTLTVTADDQGNTGIGGHKTSQASIDVAVALVNDPPVNTVPGAQTIAVDGTLVFTGPLAISVADPDVGTDRISVTLTATAGTLSLSQTTGLSLSQGTGTGDAVVAFEGTLIDVNAALLSLTFSPNNGYAGPASVKIETSDLGYTGSGGAKTDTDTVSIVVGSAPVVSVAAAQATEGGNLSFVVTLANAWGAETRVDFATQDGTALAGVDFSGDHGTLIFAAGETSKTIVIATATDNLVEGIEGLTLVLSNPNGLVLGTATAAGTILDGTTPPSPEPPKPNPPSGTVPEVTEAIGSVLPGLVPVEKAEEIADAIKRGDYTFEQFVDKLVEQAQPTVVPSLIVSNVLGGEAPTQQHLTELAVFAKAQLDAYAAAGALNPALGVYEALGLGNSETVQFRQQYGSLPESNFIDSAYQNVFGRAPSAAQIEHFAAQIHAFEMLYLGAGQSAADAQLHAKGAVIGQMIGHAVIDEPSLHGFDDAANGFLRQAAVGQAHYGEPLPLA